MGGETRAELELRVEIRRLSELVAELRRERQELKETLERATPGTSESRHRFLADLLEQSHQAFAIGYPDGRLHFVNAAFERLTGYARDELQSVNWIGTLTPPEWREKGQAELAELRITGCPVRYRKEYRRKDGTRVPVELFVHLAMDDRGQLVYYAFLTDLTGRQRDLADMRRAEEALRESQASFRALSDTMQHGVIFHDADGAIFAMNPAAESILGKTSAEFLGVTAIEQQLGCVHEDGSPFPDAERPSKIALATGNVVRNVIMGIHNSRGQSLRWIEITAVPLFRSGEARPYQVYTVFADITERKRAEQALRESEHRLAADLEAMTRLRQVGTLFASEHDLGLVLAEVVEAAKAISGADFGSIQLLDRQSGDLKLAAQSGLPAYWVDFWDSVAEGQGSYGTALRRRERVIVEDVERSPIFAGRPGLEIQLKAGVRAVQSTPLVSRSGNLLGMFSTQYRQPHRPDERTLRFLDLLARHAADIIERARAEEALVASESRFRALFESASQAVLAADQAGHIVLVNSQTEETFGYRRDELLGLPLETLLPDSFREGLATRVTGYFSRPPAGTMTPRLEWKGRARDGHEFPVEVSLSFVEQAGTRLALALVTDITERKKAEERMRQSQKLEGLGLLAGGVAHDFNNLLVGVIGSASLAQEMLPREHPAYELIQAVIQTGEQAAHLTRQMLAYSGKGKFLMEPLDLSAMIPELVGLVQPSISKKIPVHLELDRNLPSITADRGQVQQVFMNLALNAAESIGADGGAISVRTGARKVDDAFLRLNPEVADLRPGEYVFLEVLDTGCGMDAATRLKIFDPFFSTKFTGRGLGLAAVAGIVRSHKGAIVVVSEPGRGSSFTVLFPSAAGEVPQAAATASRPASQETGVILVVDDEPAVRAVARKALERQGYTVLLAESGPAAIDILKRHPGDIALVLLDLSMPKMSGQEALPQLRQIRPRIKVIVSSGYAESETMALFGGQQVSGFVQKPYTASRLAEKIKLALA